MCSAFTDSELFFADYLLLGFIFHSNSLWASAPDLMWLWFLVLRLQTYFFLPRLWLRLHKHTDVSLLLQIYSTISCMVRLTLREAWPAPTFVEDRDLLAVWTADGVFLSSQLQVATTQTSRKTWWQSSAAEPPLLFPRLIKSLGNSFPVYRLPKTMLNQVLLRLD